MKHTMFFLMIAAFLCGAAVADSPPIRVGILTDGISEHWTGLRDAALALAEEHNVAVDFRMPSPATIEQQHLLAGQMLDSGVTALAICPLKPGEQEAFLKELAGRVKLLTLQTDAPDSGRRAFLGRDEHEVGRLLGEQLMHILPLGLKVMAFCRDPEADQTRARMDGLRESVGDNFWVEGPQQDFGDRMLAAANLGDVLKRRPEIACLIGLEPYHGGLMARAVIEAGRARMVRVLGVGASPDLVQALQQGIAHGLVVDDAPGAAAMVVRALKALADEDDAFEAPENGHLVTPVKVVATESMLTPEEMMDALKVQIPWLSEADPGNP